MIFIDLLQISLLPWCPGFLTKFVELRRDWIYGGYVWKIHFKQAHAGCKRTSISLGRSTFCIVVMINPEYLGYKPAYLDDLANWGTTMIGCYSLQVSPSQPSFAAEVCLSVNNREVARIRERQSLPCYVEMRIPRLLLLPNNCIILCHDSTILYWSSTLSFLHTRICI